MMGFLGNLLKNSDGSVPWLPIIIAMILGAVIALLYAKFKKPSFLFENHTPVCGYPVIPPRPNTNPSIAPSQPPIPDPLPELTEDDDVVQNIPSFDASHFSIKDDEEVEYDEE